MPKSLKNKRKKPKPSPSIQKMLDDNRAKTQALKKLLKFIEGDESYVKVFLSKPKNESDKPT